MRAALFVYLLNSVVPGVVPAQDDDPIETRFEEGMAFMQKAKYRSRESLPRNGGTDQIPDTDIRKAKVWNNLGAVYHQLGKYSQAEELYRRAIPSYEGLQGVAGVGGSTWSSIISGMCFECEADSVRPRPCTGARFRSANSSIRATKTWVLL